MIAAPLPLPLTPFEESMLVDDQAAYPWNMLYRLKFVGGLQQATFLEALRIAVRRQPLLNARVRRTRIGRYVWEAQEFDPASCLHWNEHDFGAWPPIQKLDLAAGATMEVWVRTDAAATEVVLHIHHVCIDGQGSLQLMSDLLFTYDALATGAAQEPQLPRLDTKRLRQRCGYTIGELIRLSPKLLHGLLGVRQFLGRKTVPLVPHTKAPRDELLPKTYPCTRTYRFSRDETEALVSAARRQGVTVNDLLVRDLFCTVTKWQQSRGDRHDKWLRMVIPYSLRHRPDPAMPGANIVSLVFLDRRQAASEDGEALLHGINDEMNLIKNKRLELIYLLSTALPSWVPGLIGWLAKRQQFTSTIAFVNLVRIFHDLNLRREDEQILVGDARLEVMEPYAPLRPNTCVAIDAATYAGRLGLSMNVDPRFLTPSDADELLGEFVARVKSTLAAEPRA